MSQYQAVAAGRYTLDETGKGSAILRWTNELGTDVEDGDQEIPAEIWKLLKAVMAGQKIDPQAALRLLSGGRTVRRGLE